MCFADFAGRGFAADSAPDIIAMLEEAIEDVGSDKTGGTGEEDELRFVVDCAHDDGIEPGLLRYWPSSFKAQSTIYINWLPPHPSFRHGFAILVDIMMTAARCPRT